MRQLIVKVPRVQGQHVLQIANGYNTLFVVIYIECKAGVQVPDEQIRQQLIMEIQKKINQQSYDVKPLVDFTVLEPPDQGYRVESLCRI